MAKLHVTGIMTNTNKKKQVKVCNSFLVIATLMMHENSIITAALQLQKAG